MANKVVILKRRGVPIPKSHPRTGNGKWQKIAKEMEKTDSRLIAGPRWMATNLMVAINKMYGKNAATCRRRKNGKSYEVWRIK